MGSLPCHFVWSDGEVSTSLAELLSALSAKPEAATWHLSQGHLQYALSTQGYASAVEGAVGDKALSKLTKALQQALDASAPSKPKKAAKAAVPKAEPKAEKAAKPAAKPAAEAKASKAKTK